MLQDVLAVVILSGLARVRRIGGDAFGCICKCHDRTSWDWFGDLSR